MKYFIIGDIHGRYDLFSVLLQDWNPKEERLVLLGDYIDRGPESKKVLETVFFLRETYDVVLLKGNHEDMLLQWLEQPLEYASLYLPQGGFDTLSSFYSKEWVMTHHPAYIAARFQTDYAAVVKGLQTLQSYYDVDDFVFVHAGVDLSKKNWHTTNLPDFYWIREPFFTLPNHTGKTFFFGHTPTSLLHPDGRHDIWISRDGSRVGLDGGAVFGGFLHGLHLDNERRIAVSVNQEGVLNKQTEIRQEEKR